MLEPALYVVATPIGNLQDMTPRAVDVLQRVELIAAEDTRHSARLMAHCGIDTRLVSVHEHNERQRIETIVHQLQSGASVALISDAGTPLISDPGYVVVKGVREAGYKVVPVPGCVAFVAALSAAGLPTDRFAFEGFLPHKSSGRKQQLKGLVDESRTLIFYESPHRILASLKDMQSIFGGDRVVAVARELTKTYETIHVDKLDALLEWMAADNNQQRGEFVVLVHGVESKGDVALDAKALEVLDILLAELPASQAASLAAKITGLKKKVLYQAALER
ncbi:16S rRNA (cytidine(1402)-2'-O)-methyltransferase [Neptuniibacter sp. UBA6509]|uniref:16S rRNA (cytidine(1402)-2'-O)-methyltransferase n=2 Tax=unclassified Neptuniibacter TaxID=2630693 RepID=UPI000C5D17F3|nr:16S rRNA (cytidine(1402)-2'-O)-methyltransferase [Neptuniibacter sp. UBA6509]MAY43387.1 16S rRNA (cytidine(1402)-2'-O)-methyltransferase [Oceanospirillaceae bacterium]|tara:strand:+ start:22885 stop:23718 length:834 start_codon:yes stop_codon:yes gene_type:complete